MGDRQTGATKVCAGGRYDGLVQQLGGKPTPAVGFSIGVERLLLLIETLAIPQNGTKNPFLFIIASGDEAMQEALILAEKLRNTADFGRL